LDDYIVDFICFEKKLVIEVDGGQHNEDINREKDKKEQPGSKTRVTHCSGSGIMRSQEI
jgi:very-short-patch-repair endonuclease